MIRLRYLMAASLALVLAGCSGTGDGGGAGAGASDEPERTVTVTLRDDMSIELSDGAFAVGETIRFEVTNAGQAQHEFYLGDADAQAEHAEEMQEMDGMGHDDPNGVSVDPGATETLVHTFTQGGEILVGCHEPGHYDAGMVAALAVEG